MSKAKSEIRATLFHEFGSKVEDVLEATKRELAQYQGGKSALIHAQKKVEEHLKFVDKDVENGTLSLEEAAKVKKYIAHCVGIINNLAVAAEVQIHESRGKTIANEQIVKLAKSLYDVEQTKLQLAEAVEASPDVVEEGRPAARLPGAHPGNPLADRRAPQEPAPAVVEAVPAPPEPKKKAPRKKS